MTSVILYPNLKKKAAVEIAHTLFDMLKKRGITLYAPQDAAEILGALPVCEKMLQVMAVIAVGGDGTILRMAHEYPAWEYPVLGVNLGGLGFMTDVQVQELDAAMDDFLRGEYNVQKRLMMEVKSSQGVFHAINDLCIHRGRLPCLIETHVHVADSFVSTFNSDGLVIATPNGSTAYSLSAGGPIIWPQMECFVLTPICPHTLSNRPIVIPANHPVRIQYLAESKGADLSIDGFIVGQMEAGETLYVQRSEDHFFRWVELHRHDYYQTLRNKLGWNAQPRNQPSR